MPGYIQERVAKGHPCPAALRAPAVVDTTSKAARKCNCVCFSEAGRMGRVWFVVHFLGAPQTSIILELERFLSRAFIYIAFDDQGYIYIYIYDDICTYYRHDIKLHHIDMTQFMAEIPMALPGAELPPRRMASQGLGQLYAHDAQAAQTHDAHLVPCAERELGHGRPGCLGLFGVVGFIQNPWSQGISRLVGGCC